MESKFLNDLIEKELGDLNVLVNEIITGNGTNALLCELAASKSQALSNELKLLAEKISVTEAEIAEPEPIKSCSTNEVIECAEPELSEEATNVEILIDIVEIETEEIPQNTDDDKPEIIGWIPELDTVDQSFSINELADPLFDNPLVNELVTDSPISSENELFVDLDQEPSPTAPDEPEPAEILIEETEPEIQSEIIQSEDITTNIEEITEPIKSFSNSIVEEEQPKKVLGEKFSSETTLNDRLKEKVNLEPKFKESNITDLRSAIGLNDRFLFIRELFENDSEKFNSTIDALNGSANLSTAADYLENNFRWAKNDVSLKFIAILKRRFQS